MSILKIEPAVANSSANFAFGNVFAANYYYANGAIFSGGGSGTVKYTTATTPPASNNSPGDQWFNTTTQTLYEYINDGTGNVWVDILTPTFSTSISPIITSGNSVLSLAANSNLSISIAGTSNVMVVANTGAIVTGDITATGNIIAGNITGNHLGTYVNVSNGFYSVGTYTGSYTDGIVVDYINGNGRISVGPVDGLQVYNGGVASNLIFSISPTGNANVTNALNVVGNTTLSNASISGTLTSPSLSLSGNLTVLGWTTLQQSTEVVNSVNGATGVVVHDVSIGSTYYHTSPAANFTVNFTNVPTTDGRITVVSLLVVQGATAYIPNAVQIAGVAQTIKWANSSTPNGNASKTDVFTFSLLRISGAWVVYGQSSNYG